METGILWFDNTPGRPTPDKIRIAVDYYREKYGDPTDVEIALSDEEVPELIDGVRISKKRAMLPNHFLVGEDGQAGNVLRPNQGSEHGSAEFDF